MADKNVKLKLTLSDGRIIESNAFTLPQGPVGPAGSATLPNYVSFEKPTSISVNASGGERTVTGVAEWEAAGEMESGEYHIIDEEPLYMVKFHNGTANPTLGTEFADNDDAFNRSPKVNELFTFMWRNIISGETFIGTSYNISTGMHAIKDFITCKTSGTKKYQHNICMKTDGAYAISFQVVSDVADKYITISQLKDLFGELVDYPASGLVLVGTEYKNVLSIKKVTNIMYIQPWEGASSAAYSLADTARIVQDTVVQL